MAQKHERRILPVPGGYKGYYLYQGEIIEETKLCESLIEAANELKLIAVNKSSLSSKPVTKTVSQPTYLPSHIATTPRRCCGRG